MTVHYEESGRSASPFMIAGVQLAVDEERSNVARMLAHIERTAELFPATGMVVFSELAPRGPLTAHALDADGLDAHEAPFREAARRLGLWIIPGSSFVRRADGLYNHAVVIAPSGEVAGRYDKIFPFRPFESGVAAGRHLLTFDVPSVGKFGLAICYDLWFPEVGRALTSLGVEAIIHPVLTGTTDRDAEVAIARATSAMFQCFVVDVNGVAAGGVGRSLVTDPAGRVVHEAGQSEEVFPIEIDLALVRRARRSGANGLGQVLKSFRDSSFDFSLDQSRQTEYLASLGKLEMQTPRSR